ncbi:alpha-amylase family glycosyl hydrolase [Haliangium sp.]|uniref:alpha-amylase family glycosyl hydrolase n=1 Tax=Haliangium sp. TaxID=2663208 RepID=UPI003D1189E9
MNRLTRALPIAMLAVALAGCVAGGLSPEGDEDKASADLPRSAVVQLFNWPFRAIGDEACELRRMGFSHVHVSPPTLSNPATDWWGRYQPADYRDIDGPLGDEGDFQYMTSRAEACGITIIADVVLNHMANFGLGEGDLFYPPGCDRSAALNSGGNSCLFAPQHFHNEECIADYDNQCAVMYGRICGGPGDRGLPDLATGFCEPGGFLDIESRNYDPYVLQIAKEYLSRLQDLGVRAFRFDAAKHMHPAFLYDLLTDPAISARTDFIYGEIIANRVSDASLENYRHIPELDFMDFPLTRSLIDAFGFGGDLGSLEKIAGTDRALDGLSSVSFVTNHDVWGNDGGLGYRFGSYQDELLAHMFVLGRNEGLAYVYSEFDDGPSRAYRSPGQDYVKFHRRSEVQGMLAFRTRMFGESTLPKWKDNVHLAFARGRRGFVAINKGSDEWFLGEVSTDLSDGRYIDTLSGNSFDVVGGRVQGSVPSRWGVMLVPAGECDTGNCRL